MDFKKTINKDNLPAVFKNELPSILERYGEVIYSSHKTLKKGEIYFLGLNPGGPDRIKIKDHISTLLTREDNEYLNGNWETNNKKAGWGEGNNPLQKRVNWLLSSLGYDTQDVFASNLIFVTSRDAETINFGLAGYCWRFHEEILNIIQPKMILCFGISRESPFMFINELYSGNIIDIIKDKCRYFITSIQGRDTLIVGLYHLSYYNIVGKLPIIVKIKELLASI